jgi:hypothetical protein
MTFHLIHAHDGVNARSPFRVIEQPMGREGESPTISIIGTLIFPAHNESAARLISLCLFVGSTSISGKRLQRTPLHRKQN